MTALEQRVYDRTAAHLLRQGRRSVEAPAVASSPARYHGADGARCAIGCWISDRAYRPIFEQVAVVALTNPGPVIVNADEVKPRKAMQRAIATAVGAPLPNVPWVLLRAMQHVHDYNDPHYWGRCLQIVAKKFGLVPVTPEERRRFRSMSRSEFDHMVKGIPHAP